MGGVPRKRARLDVSGHRIGAPVQGSGLDDQGAGAAYPRSPPRPARRPVEQLRGCGPAGGICARDAPQNDERLHC
eukprot:6631512-Lingulodinium_polyedra.AAC.1